jgi:hypothetical protein
MAVVVDLISMDGVTSHEALELEVTRLRYLGMIKPSSSKTFEIYLLIPPWFK